MKKRDENQAYIKGLCTQIRRLKDDIRSQRNAIIHHQERIEEIKKDARGSLIVNWTPYSFCQTVDGLSLANLKAGDQVAIIGWVTDTKTWLDKDEFGKPCSKVNFDIRETRKVSGFLTG